MEKKVMGELKEATDYLKELLMGKTPDTPADSYHMETDDVKFSDDDALLKFADHNPDLFPKKKKNAKAKLKLTEQEKKERRSAIQRTRYAKMNPEERHVFDRNARNKSKIEHGNGQNQVENPESMETGESRGNNESRTSSKSEEQHDPSDPPKVFAEVQKEVIQKHQEVEQALLETLDSDDPNPDLFPKMRKKAKTKPTLTEREKKDRRNAIQRARYAKLNPEERRVFNWTARNKSKIEHGNDTNIIEKLEELHQVGYPKLKELEESKTNNERLTSKDSEEQRDSADPPGVSAVIQKNVMQKSVEAKDHQEEKLQQALLDTLNKAEPHSDDPNPILSPKMEEKPVAKPKLGKDPQKERERKDRANAAQRAKYHKKTPEERRILNKKNRDNRKKLAKKRSYKKKPQDPSDPFGIVTEMEMEVKQKLKDARDCLEKEDNRDRKKLYEEAANAGVNGSIPNERTSEKQTVATYLGLSNNGKGYQPRKEKRYENLTKAAKKISDPTDPSDPFGVFAEMDKKVMGQLQGAKNHLEATKNGKKRRSFKYQDTRKLTGIEEGDQMVVDSNDPGNIPLIRRLCSFFSQNQIKSTNQPIAK